MAGFSVSFSWLVVFGCVHAGMSLLVAFCRVVVSTFLRMGILGWLLFLLAVLDFLQLHVNSSFVASHVYGARRLDCSSSERACFQLIRPLPARELGWVRYLFLQAHDGRDGLDASRTMRVCFASCAVHGLDAFGYDDDQRGAY